MIDTYIKTKKLKEGNYLLSLETDKQRPISQLNFSQNLKIEQVFYLKKPFIDVFYHQSSERHPGHTARAPPITRGGWVRSGDPTTTSPIP
jgi:hypothetical protein